MITYISNKDFWYLNTDDRDHLKKDYRNYTTNFDGSRTHYIQTTNIEEFNAELSDIEKMNRYGVDLHIFVSDKLGKQLNLVKEPKSKELF